MAVDNAAIAAKFASLTADLEALPDTNPQDLDEARASLALAIAGGQPELQAFPSIPVDLVAGTSMGAMVAASVALGHQPDVMVEKFLRAFSRNPIADYTVPVIALTRGRRMRRLLIEHCGDALIENTWGRSADGGGR